MIDIIELVFYAIDTVLLTAIFLLEVVQFRKEDQYMNGHKKSAGNVAGIKPFIAQAETDELDV
jgi:hypothetical protein